MLLMCTPICRTCRAGGGGAGRARGAGGKKMLGLMMRPATRVGVLGARRGFATAPATSSGAVAQATGAGPVALPGGYGFKELALLPLTLTANKLHLAGAGARWAVVGGIFLYMMIRPNEWARVSERFPHVHSSRVLAERCLTCPSHSSTAEVERGACCCCRMTSGLGDSRTSREITTMTRCVRCPLLAPLSRRA